MLQNQTASLLFQNSNETSHEGPVIDRPNSEEEEELKGIQNRAIHLQEKLNQTFQRSYSPKEEKKIQRLDLKAYGFDGSKINGESKVSQQRSVNKLDLSMFEFDGGLKKAQSSFHLNSTPIVEDKMPRSESTKVLNKIKDSEIYRRITMFDKFQEQNEKKRSFDLYCGLKAAKSVPNISKMDQFGRFAKYDRGDVSKFILAEKNRRNWRSSCDTLDSKIYSSSDDVSMEEQFTRTDKTSSDDGSMISFPDDFAMPSVKRLAETFNKTPNGKHEFESKVSCYTILQ